MHTQCTYYHNNQSKPKQLMSMQMHNLKVDKIVEFWLQYHVKPFDFTYTPSHMQLIPITKTYDRTIHLLKHIF